ncbi:helix-turn-helix domain-containing protein [Azohydromonas australica]|uniref:AraC-like ligand-binding domain-containing protein n=1 Tax=Azohydromonas australica TaxID=364039 RepID=UPI0006867E2A|nr:helix-turn-helix domain-containing protein [Azohydromonas australica]
MDTHFCTSSLRERDRYAYWHDVICRLYARATAHRSDTSLPFIADFQRKLFGTVALSDIRCEALRYDRRRDDIQRDPNEDFLLTLMLDGQAQLEQGGRVAVQRPGDLVLYDAARNFVYDFTQRYRILLVRIPRRTLLSRLPDAERMTAVTVGEGSCLGSLAAGLMRSANALDVQENTGPLAKVGASLLEMVSAAFETEVAGRRDLLDRQAALLQRAKAYLRAHLDDPNLEVESIAYALNVSPSTLSRAFASEGTTVIRWLWRQRLEASHAALCEGRATKVLDIALGCGFASGSHFSRMFKDAYGVLPHSLLRSPSRVK